MQRSRSGLPLNPPISIRLFRNPAAGVLLLLATASPVAWSQGITSTAQPTAQQPAGNTPPAGQTLPNAAKLPSYDESHPLSAQPPIGQVGNSAASLQAWRGLTVSSIQFRGVDADRLAPLQQELALQPGQPLDPAKLRSSLRRLYATGLYSTIDVAGIRTGDQVSILFDGRPQLFIGRVNVNGVSDENFTSLLQVATKLSPGTPFTQAKLDRGKTLIEKLLVDSGYYQGQVIEGQSTDPVNQQINISFVVTTGTRARVGTTLVHGDAGLTQKQFQKASKLKPSVRVSRDTVNTALAKLRSHYQKQQLLESKVTLESKTFDEPTNHLNYVFNVNKGNKVVVLINGVKASKGSIRNLVPIYEEGTVDEDLLNEGDRRIRDLYQRKGYFDITVSHTNVRLPSGQTLITYTVDLGKVHDVDSVSIAGNHYFQSSLIEPRLNVHPASIFDHRGTYSAALVASDITTITAIYEGSGFSHVVVKPVVKDSEVDRHGRPSKIAHMTVRYEITEGVQQRFGSYKLVGNIKVPNTVLLPLLNTQVGQPYNSNNLTGDRDAVLTYYLGHGYDQAAANLKQAPDPRDPNLIDVTLEITEGEQIHINKVIISGLHYTRPKTVDSHILVHDGDLLNQSALIDTQRQLYDLTLFNGVTTAVQNPNGDELRKNVLLQFNEAKRWDVTYGFGFQAQTGTPAGCNNSLTAAQRLASGITYCNPNGNFGISELVSLNVSRTNLRGTDNSLTLKTTYGSLEKIALLTFTDPHPFGKRSFTLSVDGGYSNEQDVTTYAAARLIGNVRVTERVSKPVTLIYSYQFRRITLDANTLQVAPSEVPLLSQPVTVGGPGFTFIRDTRRPTALDATGGTYNTVQEFFADGKFGAASNFNRLEGTNSSYYPFGNVHKYVFARSTRIGFERSFGSPAQELIPLPERLYAGGAQSHRGFGINAAGPRDSITGFPIGGGAVFVNSFELRLPPPTLPVVGSSVSFVVFHDMGNVFVKGSDIWPSFLRFHQPQSHAGCADLSDTDQQLPNPEHNSIGLVGLCNYNYFSHALGLGARYGTPVGPIRVDASYNLNPTTFPQIDNYNLTNASAPPQVGKSGHFNFFFSIGQAF
ncbi:POTRA domain-containing protein [Acidipila sp. EB88]|uniref:POTRA domain-containing protein n=1 Tax=Acidipila sp. EB88 TaxID=2305226 RepID=UPI000F5F169B|nr:POTRA domain-containing protein [Acidipila sp. EB88]RRA47294.1 outer membrane protein assembly factor [Acidipila sp. EB88]